MSTAERGATDIKFAQVPDGLLEHKVAIVTGASRGIGAAAARAFAQAGAAVVLAARDEPALEGVARDIAAAGGRALAMPSDVGDPAAVEHLIARTLDAYGHPDPEEVATVAAWLCSDQAAFITGAVIPVDGGKLAAGA